MPAARKPAAASADEAQATPVEAEVVEETKKTNPLDYLQSAMKNVKTQLKSELMTEINAVKTSVDDVAALFEAAAKETGNTADPIWQTLRSEVDALVEGRVTKIDLEGVQHSIEQLEQGIRDLYAERPATPLASTEEYLPGKHILTAIHQVMKVVTYVPKTGDYEGGRSGTYKFRKFDDTAAAIGKAFRDYGVFVQTKTLERRITDYEKPFSNGGSQRWNDVYVEMRYIFTSLEDGSELTVESYGQGKDNSDKATAKAMTMALKTALTQAFMIPTDDPDPDSERPGETSEGDYSRPVGQGQGQQRPAQQQRQQPAQPRQQQAPVQQPIPPEQAQDKAARAMAAFAAAHKATDRAKLSKIINQAHTENLLGIEIQSGSETQTLQMWLQAMKHTLPEAPAAAAPPPSDLPPEPPADY